MSRTLNRVSLLGHLGQKPEIRATPSGQKVAKMSLATNDGTKDNPRTNWHRLTMWGKLADIAEQWLDKGSLVFVEGRIEYSQTEKDGVTRYWTDCVVNELIMLGGESREAQPAAAGSITEPDSDLPFAPMRLTDPLS